MGVVGTLLAILFIVLLWRFCIRRKGRNAGNTNQITPEYHPVPDLPGNGNDISLNDNSIPVTSDGYYGLGIQKYGSILILFLPFSNFFFSSKSLYGPPVTLSYYDPYDQGASSYSGQPFTPYMDQSGPSSPHAQQVHHGPQRRISALSTMTDMPPMYRPNPISEESAPILSSSSNGYTNEKSGWSPQIPPNTAGAEPEVGLTSTAIPGRREENVNVWDSGYPQPLRFVPIA
jgi:hypothetical protein